MYLKVECKEIEALKVRACDVWLANWHPGWGSPSGFWGEEKFVEILWRAKGEVCQISVLSAEFYRPLRYDH